jgi:hypothetical protein
VEREVVAVTSPSICAAAAKAYARMPGIVQPLDNGVLVVKAGNVYLVINPLEQSGEYVLGGTFDGRWRVLGRFTY